MEIDTYIRWQTIIYSYVHADIGIFKEGINGLLSSDTYIA